MGVLYSNEQKTILFAQIFASNLNANQLSFVFFLYRLTIECSRLCAPIPSISEIAETFGVDKYNFIHDIRKLVDRDILVKKGKRYGFNLEFDLWAFDGDAKSCKSLINRGIHASLSNK